MTGWSIMCLTFDSGEFDMIQGAFYRYHDTDEWYSHSSCLPDTLRAPHNVSGHTLPPKELSRYIMGTLLYGGLGVHPVPAMMTRRQSNAFITNKYDLLFDRESCTSRHCGISPWNGYESTEWNKLTRASGPRIFWRHWIESVPVYTLDARQIYKSI